MRLVLSPRTFDYNNEGMTQNFDVEVLDFVVGFETDVPVTRDNVFTRSFLVKSLTFAVSTTSSTVPYYVT
jgi:hypothetical protein